MITPSNPAEQIAVDMRKLPEETRKAIRPKLRAAGESLVREARTRASWSRKIPSTIRVRTSFRFDREGVEVVAGGKAAPHARPYEGIRGNLSFRHPVFADADRYTRKGWKWVAEPTRPFLIPAAQATEGTTTTSVRAALDEVARQIGF